MKTQYLTQREIEQAARILRSGGLVGLPTETVLLLSMLAERMSAPVPPEKEE